MRLGSRRKGWRMIAGTGRRGGLERDLDTPLGEQLLDISVRQPEAQVPADRQHDDIGREAEAGEGDRLMGIGREPRVLMPQSACTRLAHSRCNSARNLIPGVRADEVARRREDPGAAARVLLLPGDVELLTAKAERQGPRRWSGPLLCQGQEAGAVELVTLDQGGGDALPGRFVLGQEVGGPLPGQHDHVHPLGVGEVWISARAEARSSSWSSSSCQSRSARASHTTPSAGCRPSAMGPAIDTTARSQLSTTRDRKRVTGKPPGSASTLSTSRPRAWAATACAASCLAVCSVRSIPGLYHRRLRGVKTRGAAIRGVLLFWRLRQEVVLYTMSFLTLNTSYWVRHVRRRNLAFHHGFRAEQGRYIGVVRNELSPTPSAFCLGNWLDRLLIVGQRQLERVLAVYVAHYHQHRPHRALGQTPPLGSVPPPAPPAPPTNLRVVRRNRRGGLIHE